MVTVYYQTVTRHYIEALRDGNVTDHWGETLYQLWLDTDKGPPIAIVSDELILEASPVPRETEVDHPDGSARAVRAGVR